MEKEDPQLAFNEHKYIVKRLLDLISEFDIADSNITYSLLNMRPSEKIRRQQFGEEKYYTYTASQIVKITFYNVKSYLEFQIELLKMGFNQFSSSFSSTHVKGLKEEGYKKALLVAEENAIIIAKNIGKKLGSIVQIITETSDKFEFEQPTALRNIRLDRATSLTDIEQTVSVVTRLRVVYKIF